MAVAPAIIKTPGLLMPIKPAKLTLPDYHRAEIVKYDKLKDNILQKAVDKYLHDHPDRHWVVRTKALSVYPNLEKSYDDYYKKALDHFHKFHAAKIHYVGK